MKRISRLLYPKGPDRASTPLLGSVVLIVITAMTLAAWQPASQQRSADGVRQRSTAMPPPYDRWLNEDVYYLISAEERAAFEKLTSEAECDKFVEQFWLRRDPTPGTPRNEFKEEYYRRIGYSNERYGTDSGKLGWQTDRGHIYIVYGPPDEMESHPKGGAQHQYPYEVWRYRYVEGVGSDLWVTFVDRQGTGEYRIAPGKGR